MTTAPDTSAAVSPYAEKLRAVHETAEQLVIASKGKLSTDAALSQAAAQMRRLENRQRAERRM